jgi:hypothetical protein
MMTKHAPLDADNPSLNYLSMEDTQRKRGIYEKIENMFWLVHPENGLIFYKNSPQCHMDETVIKRMQIVYPWSEIKFFEKVLVRFTE